MSKAAMFQLCSVEQLQYSMVRQLKITILYLPFPWTDFQFFLCNQVVLSILGRVIEITFCSKFNGLGMRSFFKGAMKQIPVGSDFNFFAKSLPYA